uniref:Uncharacterized protein n=1 Tax=Arundo donax TaxID=35708 RepID=A0A0A9H9A9_ARUDO
MLPYKKEASNYRWIKVISKRMFSFYNCAPQVHSTLTICSLLSVMRKELSNGLLCELNLSTL